MYNHLLYNADFHDSKAWIRLQKLHFVFDIVGIVICLVCTVTQHPLSAFCRSKSTTAGCVRELGW